MAKIYWLTGQPGAGKTTIAKYICNNLLIQNSFNVDGDDIRELFDNKDYSEQGRRKNIELAQQISQYLVSKGRNVIVSLVSPYKDQRESFKKKMGDKLVEVYIHTSEIRGRENFFVPNYEAPSDSYVDINTDNKTIEECAKIVLAN